jgi:hypothetical protein
MIWWRGSYNDRWLKNSVLQLSERGFPLTDASQAHSEAPLSNLQENGEERRSRVSLLQ